MAKLTSKTVLRVRRFCSKPPLDRLRNWQANEPATSTNRPWPVQPSVTVKFRLHNLGRPSEIGQRPFEAHSNWQAAMHFALPEAGGLAFPESF